jgi:hypothetical protein
MQPAFLGALEYSPAAGAGAGAAGSAVVEELGVDRISAAEFMQLVGDAPAAKGPTDRAAHNALLVVVEPHDVLASLVFKIASGTQVGPEILTQCDLVHQGEGMMLLVVEPHDVLGTPVFKIASGTQVSSETPARYHELVVCVSQMLLYALCLYMEFCLCTATATMRCWWWWNRMTCWQQQYSRLQVVHR